MVQTYHHFFEVEVDECVEVYEADWVFESDLAQLGFLQTKDDEIVQVVQHIVEVFNLDELHNAVVVFL